MAAAMIVGGNAPNKSPKGLMPVSPKVPFKIPKPAGFGALAITVNPPPVTAPATNAYFDSSLKPGTRLPRYVSAALSVTAVRAVEPRNKGRLSNLARSG